MSKVAFALVIHSHQPVGNFDHVFHMAYEQSYLPFLEEFERHPRLKATLHYSGCLLEWIEQAHPEYFDRLRALCKSGRVEMMGGGFYEPIFTMIPDAHKAGQLRMMQEYVSKHFGQRPRGAWLPERVWEQSLTTPLARAGVEYIVLDDFHFKNAGLSEEELTGCFLTEDQGNILRIFASCELLRYYIPFQEPEKTVEYLRGFAGAEPKACIVYGDDGEKFGIWPETYKHVYEDGWLRKFFAALEKNADWLEFVTLSEAVDGIPPAGKIYLPDASYREMTEWALPTATLTLYEQTIEKLKETDVYDDVKRFLRGGFWRNFKVKYPESNRMYGRMLAVGRRIEEMPSGHELCSRATRELYRAQCNCGYWHGVFGGLYLPHLRSAVYAHLIRAQRLADEARHGKEDWLDVSELDLDLDGWKEIELSTMHLVVCLKPSSGGHMTELHLRAREKNLLDTLARRPEAYHVELLKEQDHVPVADDDGVAHSIHDAIKVKQPGLDKQLNYDEHLRESLVDYFFAEDVTLDDVVRGSDSGCGNFLTLPYDCKVEQRADGAAVVMSAAGEAAGRRVSVRKSVEPARDAPKITVVYRVCNEDSAPLETTFGVEFNFALLSGDSPGRYIHLGDGKEAGAILDSHEFQGAKHVGLKDTELGIDAVLSFPHAADVWCFPIQTVSQSEGGLELVYQSSVILPRWKLKLAPGSAWEVSIVLEIRQ